MHTTIPSPVFHPAKPSAHQPAQYSILAPAGAAHNLMDLVQLAEPHRHSQTLPEILRQLQESLALLLLR